MCLKKQISIVINDLRFASNEHYAFYREEVIQRSGMQVARNSSEMENHVFMKAKSREEYMNMVAKLILHVREMCKFYQ